MCGDVTMEKYFNLSKTLFGKPNEYQKRVLFWNSTKVFAYLKCESDWNEIGTESKSLKGMFS